MLGGLSLCASMTSLDPAMPDAIVSLMEAVLSHRTLRRIDIRHNHLSSANRPVASRKGSHQTTVADAISMLLRTAPRLVDLDRIFSPPADDPLGPISTYLASFKRPSGGSGLLAGLEGDEEFVAETMSMMR